MMLTQKIKVLFTRREDPAPVDSRPRPLPGVAPVEPSAAATLTDVLRAKVEEHGGPSQAVEPEAWMAVADAVGGTAQAEPRPPSTFPIVATQIMAMLRKPNLDVNELVGVVQRDAAIATTLVKIANSSHYAPAMPVTTLRGALQQVGTREVLELVLGSAGRSLYDIPTRGELAQYPDLWKSAFHDAIANAFTAARVALEVRGADNDRALLAGLLADVGRPIVLRVISRMYTMRDDRPDAATAGAALDEISSTVGATTIAAMSLPEELRDACLIDSPNPRPEARIARMISSIGAIQRRSPRCWVSASEVRAHAEALGFAPEYVRTVFALRAQYFEQAARTFE